MLAEHGAATLLRRPPHTRSRMRSSTSPASGSSSRISTNAKLVATQPGHEILRAQAGPQGMSHRSQHGIAGGMLVTVVDLLEMIEIDDGQALIGRRLVRRATGWPDSSSQAGGWAVP